jgi:hypothetical protein
MQANRSGCGKNSDDGARDDNSWVR